MNEICDIAFNTGKSMKVLIDDPIQWNKNTHKYFHKSLKPIVITLLCIHKYYYKQIDKNIFLKIIEEIADFSYLLDFSLFADFIITNQKRALSNTYEPFRRREYEQDFNGHSSRFLNPKYLYTHGSSFTRNRKDIQVALSEMINNKTLGLVMIISNTIEIMYLDVSKNLSCINLTLNYDFFKDLEKKEKFYQLLRDFSVIRDGKISVASKDMIRCIIFLLMSLVILFLTKHI